MKPKLSWDKPRPAYGTKEWKMYQYVMAQIARRGRSFKYDDGTKMQELESRGYQQHPAKIFTPLGAKEIAQDYRDSGNFARVILVACGVFGHPECYVYFKPKKNAIFSSP
jgi:hypothetical protein